MLFIACSICIAVNANAAYYSYIVQNEWRMHDNAEITVTVPFEGWGVSYPNTIAFGQSMSVHCSAGCPTTIGSAQASPLLLTISDPGSSVDGEQCYMVILPSTYDPNTIVYTSCSGASLNATYVGFGKITLHAVS